MAEGGAGYLAVTWWKSATVEMRDYGIDAYLSDLNVAIMRTTHRDSTNLQAQIMIILEPLAESLSEAIFFCAGRGRRSLVRQGRSCSRRRG
jgi:hypothetical protein